MVQTDRLPAGVRASRHPSGARVLMLDGRLDSRTTGSIWREAMRLVEEGPPGDLIVDASGLEYCDGSGVGLLIALRRRQRATGAGFEVRSLRDEVRHLLERLDPGGADGVAPRSRRSPGTIEALGRHAYALAAELRELVAFVGELAIDLLRVLRSPARVRLKEVVRVTEQAGIGAMPIVLLVGFLLGLILAFQSAIPMSRFGAQIFVADLLGLSLLRELGPLMAAILLTARSGSAFAAELGTMKVNEEIDALTTMGLEPVRFLIVPRVLAAMLAVPVLTVLTELAGLVGGAVVFRSLEFPLVTYVNRIVEIVSLGDFLGGLFKAFVFGIIVAAVGCLRGLQTGGDAGAVGASTTSSVVSGIVLIAAVDGLFAVVFYVLGL